MSRPDDSEVVALVADLAALIAALRALVEAEAVARSGPYGGPYERWVFSTARHSVMAITSAREHWAQDSLLTKGGTNVSGNLHAATGSDGAGGQGGGHHHQEHVALRSRHLAGADAEGGLTSRTT